MTPVPRTAGGAVPWLTAQALLFGAMAALLGVVANAMFLDTYGAGWLPATYIAIGIAGIVVSGIVARTAQRFDLVGLAVTVLGGAAIGIGIAWVVARDGSAPWVSIPLLVLFPILIQLGFVFIGGQAGRILDIAGIKAGFPRIMTGFPVGAVLGGLLAGQLVAWLGRTEELLFATAVAQAGFAALVWWTGRRYADRLRATVAPPTTSERAAGAHDQVSLRRLFASRFVALILAYQVLSALGSQLSDYLVYDRAGAQFTEPADLARFLAGYTAAINVASIAFLFLLAGPLLRRFGLRLGITANPFVLGAFAVAMLVVLAVAGAGSMALLLTVTAARIADIALTDGTTRTSINVTYQVVPERSRLAIQAAVEGIGVPVAIGVSGVVILACNALASPLGATLAVTLVVCGAWSWGAVLLYRAYGPALVHALRRTSHLVEQAHDSWLATPDDEAVARELLASGSARSLRLGMDLLGAMSSPAIAAELGALADDPRPDVRMAALGGLAASGDEHARRRLADAVLTAAAATDPGTRVRAAHQLGMLDPANRAAAGALLLDDDQAVRCAALDAVQPGDRAAVDPAIAALGDPGSIGAAAGAVGRLGDAVIPALESALERAGVPADPLVLRLVRAAATASPARDEVLRRFVSHSDRELGLVVIERLAAPGPAPDETAALLDAVLATELQHAAAVIAAIGAFEGDGAGDGAGPAADSALRRALADELDLARFRVRAVLLARHGTARLGSALVELAAGGPNRSLAHEAVEVVVGPAPARVILPLLDPEERPAARPAQVAGVLRDLVEDADGHWRSGWLRACALHAARARDILDEIDLSAARAIGDPIVDEELRGSGAA